MPDIRSAPGSAGGAAGASGARPGCDGDGELAGVLFDMDGLLVDTEPLWFEVESGVMARLGGSWSESDQAALVGGSLARSLDYLLGKATRPASRETVARWMLEGMVELLATRPVPVLPGARELIAEVAAAGVPYGLVTSSEGPIMTAVLDRLQIRFPVTVCGDDVSHEQAGPGAVPAGRGEGRRGPAAVRGAGGLAEWGGRRGGGGLRHCRGAEPGADPRRRRGAWCWGRWRS